ncbi:alpha/beta hydrolase [Streptacidiphilus melanogenes]|uniref:alpha/beta hydrolase n=1 Tax=Streptacidiphilus melanogenes TaxID=411235 RepID=UPI0007C69FF1|nr:alpha/beta fold hydrolase [Streptacidiphilus melanogenes]
MDTSRSWRYPAQAQLITADGVTLHAEYLPPGDGASDDVAVVLAHGFTGAVERPALRRAARVFARYGGVVTFSFRGHGRSGGLSTVGDREVLDLDAAVAWARSLGFARVVTVGFSMGGAVAVRHAALSGGVTATAAVSAPARWYYQGTVPMRRLHWVVMRPLGRVVGRVGLKTRIDPKEWTEVPLPPVAAAARLTVPLLVVHGDADPYFPLDHPRSLAQAASASSPKSELWIEPGFGHAENAAPEPLLERVARWVTVQHEEVLEDGRKEGREEATREGAKGR